MKMFFFRIRFTWELVTLALANRQFRIAFAAVVLVDLVLMILFGGWALVQHQGRTSSFFYRNPIFGAGDWSLIELFGYLKEAAALTILLALFRNTKMPVYLSLAMLVTALLLDDSLRFHEAIGRGLSGISGVHASLTQVAAAGLLGVLPLAALVWGWIRSEEPHRRNTEAVLSVVGILLFFGVVVDSIKHALYHADIVRGFRTVSIIIEDGGELLSLTLLVLIVTGVYVRHRAGSGTPTGHSVASGREIGAA